MMWKLNWWNQSINLRAILISTDVFLKTIYTQNGSASEIQFQLKGSNTKNQPSIVLCNAFRSSYCRRYMRSSFNRFASKCQSLVHKVKEINGLQYFGLIYVMCPPPKRYLYTLQLIHRLICIWENTQYGQSFMLG